MKHCTELRAQLEDVALGGAASSQLSSHLAECATCASELSRLNALARRLDETVAAAVRAEPPPQLLDGVAARLSLARDANRLPAIRSRLALYVAAATCTLLLAIGVRFLAPPYLPRSELSALAAWHSPTDSLLAPSNAFGEVRRRSAQPAPGGTDGS